MLVANLLLQMVNLLHQLRKKPISSWIKKTVHLKKFSPEDFVIKSQKPEVEANTIFMQTEIITKIGSKLTI